MRTVLLAALLLALAPAAALAQTTVYAFNANTGITGSVTLTAGINGPVSTGDILAFNFIEGPGNTLVAPLSGTVARGFGLLTNGVLAVLNGNLYFDPPIDVVGSENLDGYYGIAFDNGAQSAQSPQPDFIITDDPYLQGGIGTSGATEDVIYSDQDLASAPSSPAPEIDPANAIGALTLLAGIGAVVRGRRPALGSPRRPLPGGCTLRYDASRGRSAEIRSRGDRAARLPLKARGNRGTAYRYDAAIR